MSPFNDKSTSEEVAEAFASEIQGRIFVITGTSANGIGAYVATSLARHSPAQIVLLARNKAKVDPVVDEIAIIDPKVKVTFVSCELSDQDSIRAAAEAINNDSSIPHIDVLINNAGIMMLPTYQVDNKGYEMQLSTNHIGPFLLTNLLLAKVRAAGPAARVVMVSSSGHRISPFRFDDWNFSGAGKTYDGWTAYGQSKTATNLTSVELTRRGVTALSAHPGTVMATGLGRHLDLGGTEKRNPFALLYEVARRNTGRDFALSPEKTLTGGASTLLAAALDPALKEQSGAFVADCQVEEASAYSQDPEAARKLWALTEELVGQKFPE